MSTNSKNSNLIEWRVIDKTDGRSLGSVFAASRAGALRKAVRNVSTPREFITVAPVDPNATVRPDTTREDVQRAVDRLCDRVDDLGTARGTARSRRRAALQRPPVPLDVVRAHSRPLIDRSARADIAAVESLNAPAPPAVPEHVAQIAAVESLNAPTFRVHGVVTIPFVVEVAARDADTAERIVDSWESVLSFASGVTGVRLSDDHTHRVESVEPVATAGDR